ncbi:hypothetical protein BE15_45080 [Sorangium cellulosum]|uniref:Uncharacterized protein n=1 Tax=Sorangium cellulosum TaxID=56 RepID=A0A150QJX3_SORCE|nr:hypothetical protein [Sorangium cellulosum]KYF67948.1 hypothetical protein BE15_45080 [Sorangium cellulosum]
MGGLVDVPCEEQRAMLGGHRLHARAYEPALLLAPEQLLRAGAFVRDRELGRIEEHLAPEPSALTVVVVGRYVDGDAVQPSLRRSAPRVVPGEAREGREEDLLRDIRAIAGWDPEPPQPAKHGTNDVFPEQAPQQVHLRGRLRRRRAKTLAREGRCAGPLRL